MDRESATETRLGELYVGNFDAEPHTVHVLLIEGDDPVYWESLNITGSSDPARPNTAAFDGYPTEAGSFELYVWRDEQPRSEWRTFDLGASDRTCESLDVMIGYDHAGEVQILRHTPCEEDNSETTDTDSITPPAARARRTPARARSAAGRLDP